MIEGITQVKTRMLELEQLVNPGAVRFDESALAELGAGTGSAASGGTSSTTSSSFDDLIQQLREAAGTGEAGSTGATGGTSRADRVISTAEQYLGVPYLWGGTDPDRGLDCSGLVQLVYRQNGVDLPRVSRDQARAGRELASLDQARPGDLVFFHSPVSHVGIYLGDGMMLDAPKTGDKVKIQKVWATPSHIRRVLPDDAWSSGGSSSAAAVGGATGVRQVKAAGTSDLGGPYANLFTAAGRTYGVDPALLSAVAGTESGYRPQAVSSAGARGLMQIMPATARGLGIDPMDPAQAVDGAARLLSGYLKTYGGDVDLALAAYNAGPGAVKKYGGVPPYHETRTYIDRVRTTWKDL